MTHDRALKEAIRRRMAQTGEKYTEARRALTRPVDPLEPGEARTVIVAWRLDDPAVHSDGRFWIKVMKEFAQVMGRPAGTIVPAGRPLSYWRSQADGGEVEVPNPVSREKQRFSIARWEGEDPDRTHIEVSFASLPEEFAGRSTKEVDRLRDEWAAKSSARRVIKPTHSKEVQKLVAERDELWRQRRAAVDQGDEQQIRELSAALQIKFDELRRADFPNHSSGWDLSRAIRKGAHTFILDWTTGYGPA